MPTSAVTDNTFSTVQKSKKKRDFGREKQCDEDCLIWQGRAVGNGKKKMEAAAAAQEDRDKPYACDSKLWCIFCVL